MANSKVVFGGETLIDLTGDTVKADTLALGETAHDKAGNPITGTMEPGGYEQIDLGWLIWSGDFSYIDFDKLYESVTYVSLGPADRSYYRDVTSPFRLQYDGGGVLTIMALADAFTVQCPQNPLWHDDEEYTFTFQMHLAGMAEMTADGTATPEDVLQGKVAYSQFQRIEGTHVCQGVTPETPSITVSSSGLITATANGLSKTQQLTTQAAKSVTPTKSSQTAVASGRYTTGNVTVGAIPSEYIVPSGSQTITSNGTVDVTSLASVIVNVAGGGGGLPDGFTAIATGTHTLGSAVSGGSTFTVTHNLGTTPDMFLFYATANIATTYSMLSAMRCSSFGWRSSSYLNLCFYHGNSTTTATGANVTTNYGIKSLSATTATVTTYSSSTSYYWRAGTYKWVAIKF